MARYFKQRYDTSERRKRQRRYREYVRVFAFGLFAMFLAYISPNVSDNILIAILFGAGALFVLIFVLKHYVARRKHSKYLNNSLHDIDSMSGREFEEYLFSHFTRQGYSVWLTPASGDYGADLVISKNGEKTVVQAKRHKDKIGNGAIQEIVAAKGLYDANKCIVITNSHYTENAKVLAKANDVELWDRETLVANFNIGLTM